MTDGTFTLVTRLLNFTTVVAHEFDIFFTSVRQLLEVTSIYVKEKQK